MHFFGRKSYEKIGYLWFLPLVLPSLFSFCRDGTFFGCSVSGMSPVLKGNVLQTGA